MGNIPDSSSRGLDHKMEESGFHMPSLHQPSEQWASKVAIPVAVVAVSFAAIFVRLSEAPPIAKAFYRMLFSTFLLLILVPRYFDELRELKKREWFILISAGFFLAAHMAAWVSSLSYTSVASSVVLVTSHPLLVAWISERYLNERTSREAYLGILIGLGGITIMTLSDYRFSHWGLFGDFLALLGMVAVTGYIIRGRQMRQKLHVVPYAFTVYGISTLFLAAFFLGFSTPLEIYAPREYALFLALALVPTMLGHTLYNWALKYIKARTVSVSLLGEPIGASILALLLLNEIPPGLTIVGAMVTLTGIFICEVWAKK